MCLYIEVDAYAFTKYILKRWFNDVNAMNLL